MEGFQVSIAPVSEFVTIGGNDVATVNIRDDDSELKSCTKCSQTCVYMHLCNSHQYFVCDFVNSHQYFVV